MFDRDVLHADEWLYTRIYLKREKGSRYLSFYVEMSRHSFENDNSEIIMTQLRNNRAI